MFLSKSKIYKIENISDSLQQEMWELYQESYSVSKESYDKKRSTLNAYLLFFNRKNKLIGYTGIRDDTFIVNDKKYRSLYFGQGLLTKKYRGKSVIQLAVIKLLFKHIFSFNELVQNFVFDKRKNKLKFAGLFLFSLSYLGSKYTTDYIFVPN